MWEQTRWVVFAGAAAATLAGCGGESAQQATQRQVGAGGSTMREVPIASGGTRADNPDEFGPAGAANFGGAPEAGGAEGIIDYAYHCENGKVQIKAFDCCSDFYITRCDPAVSGVECVNKGETCPTPTTPHEPVDSGVDAKTCVGLCTSDPPTPETLECVCRSWYVFGVPATEQPAGCPTLAQMKQLVARQRLLAADAGPGEWQGRWSYSVGCNYSAFETRWGAGDGQTYVFENSSERLVGLHEWSDVGPSIACLGIHWDGYESSFHDVCPTAQPGSIPQSGTP